MIWQEATLAGAGVIGGTAAPIHGMLVRRSMSRPLGPLMRREGSMSPAIVRLVPMLLDFSAFNWFLGGVALIAAAFWFGTEARMVTAALVGSSYLFASLANFWGTRGRHPGWSIYAVAVVLILASFYGMVG